MGAELGIYFSPGSQVWVQAPDHRSRFASTDLKLTRTGLCTKDPEYRS